MKIIPLRTNPEKYSSQVYLVLGSWNTISDANTLIDAGIDGHIISQIDGISTGVGKKTIERVILTHGHFDHKAGIKFLRERYNPEVCAFAPSEGVTRILKDGEYLKLGDRIFQVMHFPIHSNDSICLYSPEEKVLFSGDTPLRVLSSGGTYPKSFSDQLLKLLNLPIEAIYSGHDAPIIGNIKEVLRLTYENVQSSHSDPDPLPKNFG